MDARKFVKALKELEGDKNIPSEIVLDSLKQALVLAYQQKIEGAKDSMARVEIDPKKGNIKMYAQKTIVEEVEDDYLEISLEDAQVYNPDYKVGDIYETEVNVDDYNRMAAQYVKQILRQKLREAEKQIIFDEYIEHKDDIIVGSVERVEPNFCLINLGKANALMPASNRIPNENLEVGQLVKVYVVDVDKKAQGAQVIVSRTDTGFLKRLFEQEIVEIYDGTVEIRSIAREPGERAKVAVSSRNKDVDAPGACIGQKGIRIQRITSQIANEKIDVIQYFDEPELFIAEALKPANVYGIAIDEANHSAIAIVPNDEFSLAIGKRGQNARLAVKLTKWKIDIKTIDDALREGIRYETLSDVKYRYAAPVVEEEVYVAPVVEETKVEVTPVVEEVVTPVVEETKVEVTPVEEAKVTKHEEVIEKVVIKEMVKSANHISVVEEEKVEEAPKQQKAQPKKKVEKKEEVEETKVEAPKNYMPIYTQEELDEFDEEEEYNDYDDDDRYDEYDDDSYYDE